ncbi:MAG: ribonuclease III domain-containing protein [Bacilli bacterium]|nr:ribonuclease III domain-containing protein [Bacilli bacterium]MDD3304671.1 ribonuclease III domain-containing protein [Bacilli bacterium]MDD4053277.1 ribonuclease III domain-containing protein [Bacilli bacterium]MDD4411383.1 ribonuclease III domain-containing protein [Bacilli bacterium]
MNVNQINTLVLAYLGDSIYELYIRRFLIEKNINKVNDLQKEAVKYVSAKSQSAFLNKLTSNNLLLEDELDIVKRARNAKTLSHPKNVDILTYKHATALEALIGYLYILKKEERINEIMKEIIGE